MIRMIQSKSAQHARDYFTDALSKSDYYVSDQELPGQWAGQLAARLELSGAEVAREDFHALAENRHPRTGERLTPRTDTRRTVGYDINFHCPKSVSILHALSEDTRILDAFQSAADEVMKEIEAHVKTRIRGRGPNGRTYGDTPGEGLVWGRFVHQTARPAEGHLPDPHLHAHFFVCNLTWNPEEKRFKAVQFRDIKRDMPYYQARFHVELANRLQALGYGIRRTDKSFEIDGVPRAAIALFSKRTDEIGRAAQEKGITDPKALDQLGARTRAKKTKGLSMAELRAEWRAQILGQKAATREEIDNPPRKPAAAPGTALMAQACVDFAVLHCFERASVMSEHRIKEIALRQALGTGVTVAALGEAFMADPRLIRVKEGGRTMCTTREVLGEEKRMIALVKEGKGRFAPIYGETPKLSVRGQQAQAVAHVLTTTNQVSIIMGAAGSGKTTLMQEAVAQMEAAGKKVVIVAPSANAARGVLREESGFAEADTVAQLLLDKEWQKQLQGQVLWVDEAGLLGTKDTVALLELAKKHDARVIFGGDTRQHASVVRGDALRIINTVGGVRAAEVNKIYRQRNARYRAAVEDLAKGRTREGFDKLDAMGSIIEVDEHEASDRLVEDYIASVKARKDTLVISPTHAQGDAITEAIRQRLKKEKMMNKRETQVPQLRNLNLTEAQKADERNFRDGQIVQFSQNVKGFKRGSQWRVEETEDGVQLTGADGQSLPLPAQAGKRFEVYAPRELALSKGDKVRITRGGTDRDGQRLDNGQALKVVSVTDAAITLQKLKGKKTFTLPRDYGHIAYGHCVTSHASQGMTVDRVFIYQPSGTFPATDAKSFYVPASRAKEEARFYTNDKEGLLAHASELGDRQSALELVSSQSLHRHFAMQQHRAEIERQQKVQQKDRTHGIDRQGGRD